MSSRVVLNVLRIAAPLLFVLAIAPSALAQQTTYFMPVLLSTNEADLGLALSNPTLEEATVTLTARSYAGALITGADITNPATVKIPASGQRALRPVEMFGTGIAGRTGWVQIVTSSPAVKGFFLTFDAGLNYIDGADLVSAGSSRIIFPKVATGTTISFAHTGNTRLNLVGVTLYNNSGTIAARRLFSLDAYAGFSGPVEQLVPDATGFEGYAVVDSAGTPFTAATDTLVGFESYRNRADVATLNAIPEANIVRTGYLAHLASQGGYYTSLSLINTTSSAQTIRITADGMETAGQSRNPASVAVDRTIPPYGRLDESADRLFNLSGNDLITGYVRYETQGNTRGVTGYLEYGTTDGVLLSAVPAQSSGFSDLFFSHVAEGQGFYTGIALLNANTQAASVTVDTFDRDGRRVGSTALTLAAGARRARLLSELLPAAGAQLGGYLRVTASRPVFAFQLFGSRTGLKFLANVSAQGVQLRPQASGRTVSASSGANVISADGTASIAIPPGALSQDTQIRLGGVTTSLPNPSANERVVASVEALPSGTQFKVPVKLTFPLAAQLAPGTQIELRIFDSGSNSYRGSGFTAVVDESGRTASADVTHFTIFALGLPVDQLITVSSVSPLSGVPGTTVNISGSGFSTNASENVVTFAGLENTAVAATVTAASATSITVTVPAGAVTGNLIVRVGARSSVGVGFTVPVPNPVPSIASISPTSAPFGSTSVDIQISGTGFRASSTVQYDGAAIGANFIDQTLLQVTVSGAQLSPAVHQITVSNPAPGGGSSNAAEFTVGYPRPAVSSISPSTAVQGQSVETTIGGTGFTSASVVLVDGRPIGGTYVNSTTMMATINAMEAGTRLISVTNPAPGGGESNAVGFVVTVPPVGSIVIISANNTTATVGSQVVLTVEVRNTGNAPLANISVQFTVQAGGGTVNPVQGLSGANGRVTTTITLGTVAGLNRVVAQSLGVSSDPFNVTGTAGAATQVSVSASPATITAGGAGSTITARIQDQFGNTVTTSNAAVNFSITAGPGALSAPAANAVSGVASVTLTSNTTGTTTVQGASAGLTSGTANVTINPGAPAAMAATGGTGQTGNAGVALGTPLKVQIKDANNNNVPGVTVTFSVVSGGGSVNPTSAVTNASGEAQTTATAGGTVGVQTFRAASAGLANVDINATINPGPATKLALAAAANSITAGTNTNLTITIQDQFGNTVTTANNALALAANPAATVTFGSATPAPNAGVATTTFSAQTATQYVVTASSAGLTSATVNVTVTAAAAATLQMVSGNNQTAVKAAPLPTPLVAKVVDQFGNAVAGVNVTFAVATGGGSVNPSTAQASGANGQVQATATLGPNAGANSYTATSAGLAGSPLTYNATATEAPPAAVVLVGNVAGTAPVNTNVPFTVQVNDAGGNPIPGVNVNFLKTVGNGSIAPASGQTGNDGRITATTTLGQAAGTNTFTATVTGLTPVTVSITGTAGAATQLTKVSGDTQTGNTGTTLAAALVVEARDQFNNPVQGVSVTFSVLTGGGSVNPSTAQNTAANGQAQATATLGLTVGQQSFRAAAAGLPNADFTATANQAPATQIALSGNVAATGTVATNVTINVITRDANNNPVPGVTVNFAAPAGGGSVNPASQATNAQGIATTTATLGNTAGTNTFTATSGNLTGSPVTVNVTGTAGAMTQLVKVSGDGQTGAAGGALANPLVVEARDQFNNPVAGVAVTFTVQAGGGSVNPTTAQNTAANGRVQVTATIGNSTTANGNTFRATAGALTADFTATGTLVPANIAKVAGDSQTVAPAISLLTQLKVKVTNSGGLNIPNVTVNWAAATGGGSVSAATSTTDANGEAVITATVGAAAGANTFTATVAGLTAVTFNATAKVLTATANGVVDVQISSGAIVIGAYDVIIGFDPTKMRVDTVNVVGGTGTGYTGTPTTVNINNVAGTLQVNHFQTNQTQPTGNFTVARVTFTLLRPGTVNLTTSNIVVTNQLGDTVSSNFLTLSATQLTIQ